MPGLELGDVLRVTSSTSLRDQALAGAMQAAEPILAEPTKIGTGRLRLSWPDTVPMQWKTLGDVKQPESWTRAAFRARFQPAGARAKAMPEDAPGRYVAPQTRSAALPTGPVSSMSGTPTCSNPATPSAASGADRSGDQRSRERAAMALQMVQDEVPSANGMDEGSTAIAARHLGQSLRRLQGQEPAAACARMGIEAEPFSSIATMAMRSPFRSRFPVPSIT